MSKAGSGAGKTGLGGGGSGDDGSCSCSISYSCSCSSPELELELELGSMVRSLVAFCRGKDGSVMCTGLSYKPNSELNFGLNPARSNSAPAC